MGLGSAAAENPELRVSILKFGAVNWELDTIKHRGLDTANGIWTFNKTLPGETLAVTGPSGIGKSTLLRILAGMDPDFQGSSEISGRIAMVIQEPTLLSGGARATMSCYRPVCLQTRRKQHSVKWVSRVWARGFPVSFRWGSSGGCLWRELLPVNRTCC